MIIKRFFFLFFFCLMATPAFAQESYNIYQYKGNSSFNDKNYNAATRDFLGASRMSPNDFGAHYNLGNAYYKRKMYKQAAAEYQKAETLAKTNSDRAAALYNRGNTEMHTGNRQHAAELYKKSLKINPYDEATRKNYEIAMLRENEQKNQTGQNNSGNGGNGKDKNKNRDQDKPGNNPKQQPGGSSQNSAGQGKGSDGQKPNRDPSAGNMPKGEQNAILNRIGNKERETAKRILNKNGYSTPQSNQKDW